MPSKGIYTEGSYFFKKTEGDVQNKYSFLYLSVQFQKLHFSLNN
jgi:hypothetical protein